MESVASGAESAETSTVLHGMSTDAEVSELCKRLDNTRLTASTKERTLELFKRYRYQYQFRSINVAQLYGVSEISCILYYQESYQAWIGDVTRIWRIPICEEVIPLSTGGF